MGLVEVEREIPPALPKTSAPATGGIVIMMSRNMDLQTVPKEENGGRGNGGDNDDANIAISQEEHHIMKQMQKHNKELMKGLNEVVVPRAKIADKKDGKTIGQVMSTPAPGTPIVLTHMRLDEVGRGWTFGKRRSKIQHDKVIIGGNTNEYRYAYLITGKAKAEEYNK